jgi:HAD superfamily hydrolase (TIGR01549 family)
MVKYRAVSLDASLTLWRWNYDPAFQHLKQHENDPALVLLAAIKTAGGEVDELRIRRCYAQLQPVFAPRLRAFESGGHGVVDADIRSHFAQHNAELLRLLGIEDPTGRMLECISEAFEHWRPTLFPETRDVLEALRAHGLKLAIVSNGWRQAEDAERLGVASLFTTIVGSVHVGYAKPQPEIFEVALSQLGTSPAETVHVGDDYVDDVEGARSARLDAILLDRVGATEYADVPTIRSLTELLAMVVD